MIGHDFDIARRLLPQLRGYEPEVVTIGRSTATVYRLTARGAPVLFVKVADISDVAELTAEHDRLRWLAGRVLVPSVVSFSADTQFAYLLTEGLAGISATEAPAALHGRVASSYGVALRTLHAIDPRECPFDGTLDRALAEAHQRAVAGLVDESDFDADHLGSSAMQLWERVSTRRPEFEDIVVTHGDASLPNAIFDGAVFTGFVDCGKCGRADRYQDLAIAARDIGRRFGEQYVDTFFSAYGVASVDGAKLYYYRLLNEFF